MPTVDITQAPYNAVADGAWSLEQLTIDSVGSPHDLRSVNALWAIGDVGKHITVGGAGGAFNDPGGGTALVTTIASFISSTHITLTASATASLPFSDGNPHIVAWGATDNAGAFALFNTNQQGATVTLTIPSNGTNVYLITSGNLWYGITNLTVNATAGVAIAGAFSSIGRLAQQQTNVNVQARIKTVNAGSNVLQCVTPSEISRFSTGSNFLMTGLDLQGLGFPSSHQLNEYVTITALDTSPVSPTYGQITISAPLKNTYLSTWPNYSTGSSGAPDYGGPGTLYVFDPTWPGTFVFNHLTIVYDAELNSAGQFVTFNNCTMKSLYGAFPSMSDTWTLNACDWSLITGLEADKYVGTFNVLNGTTVGGVGFQSGSFGTFNMNSSTITFTLSGTPRVANVANSVIGTLTLGPNSYGAADSVLFNNCTISNFGNPGYPITGGFSGSVDVRNDWTMAGGIITIPKSNQFTATRWAIPGKLVFFQDRTGGNELFDSFLIVGVTEDVTNSYVQTNKTGTWPTISGQLGLLVHPCPSATFVGCTGCSAVMDFSLAPPNTPLWAWSKKTFTGSVASETHTNLVGKITSIKMTVTTPYTGATGTVTAEATSFLQIYGDPALTNLSPRPLVNLRNPGVRSIAQNASSAYPISWSNPQGGDSFASFPSLIWSPGEWAMSMTDIHSESSGTWPTFTIEATTDQGFPQYAIPLRFRLHS